MKKTICVLGTLGTMLLAQDHALIVGCCSKYADPNMPLLGGTKNDAIHIKDILLDRGVEQKNLDLLVEENATYQNITQKLKAMESSDLQKGNTLYVYYSGHGTSTGDRNDFAKKLTDNADILNRLNNSAGLIPYDFDQNNPANTLIITSRDFKPTFQSLDKRGINIVWIADACYAGNAYRSADSVNSKFVTLNQKETAWTNNTKDTPYNHLLFYGAALTHIVTPEVTYLKEKRGEFTVEVENCLQKSYGSNTITNANLKNCLEQNFAPFAFSSSVYPIDNRLDEQVILKASTNTTSQSLNEPDQTYKEKLFALQSNKPPLKLNIYSEYAPTLAIDTFCDGERLNIDLLNRTENVAVFTLDSNNKIIMLYPNKDTDNEQTISKLIQTDVMPPFGTDRVKVFAVNDKSTYATIFNYKNKPEGVLSQSDAESIYRALDKSQDFQTTLVKVKTIATPVAECRKGDN